MEDWTKVSGDSEEAFSFEKTGDQLIGRLAEKKKVTTVNGEAFKYFIEKSDGERVFIWGKTALDLNMEQIRVGDMIKIVYQGMMRNPKTNRNFHSFDVYKKAAQTVQTSEDVADDVPF